MSPQTCRVKAVASLYDFNIFQGVNILIQITKSEAQLLREKFPNVHIAKTKHKRYVEEDIRAMRALTNNTEARKIVAARNKNKRGV